jgi:N-acetylmuramoyl-L-alanine amidase
MAASHRLRLAAAGCLLFLVSACGDQADPSPAASSGSEPPGSTNPSVAPLPSTGLGEVRPARGSDSAIYGPNPGAIVVAIDAGHGGCLDWGVPDPQQRGPEYSEKAITLDIARDLAAALEDEGLLPVLLRDDDEALAGDLYPELGCDGPPFRDVNGDGEAGFGPSVTEATRTRDELQARLDLANLIGADVLVSLHVDSITDSAGTLLPIARTETFYTDETPWGVERSEPLARGVQEGVVAALGSAADYERQDRGVNAHNLYMVAPPLFEPTEERPNPLRQPTRGALMPAILLEVGSMTLPAEHELLMTDAGQAAVVEGIIDGLATWFGGRELAGRIEAPDLGFGAGQQPAAGGSGPPFLATVVSGPDEPLTLRLTNTGTQSWPDDLRLVVGWGAEAATVPYLRAEPGRVDELDVTPPPLAPGESVDVSLVLAPPAPGRQLAWITLAHGEGTLADLGTPALQLAIGTP